MRALLQLAQQAWNASTRCDNTDAAPEVPSLVVRAGDVFGPGAGQSWFALALAKRPLTHIIDPGRPGVGHAWACLPDLAETIELPPGRLRPAETLQYPGPYVASALAA